MAKQTQNRGLVELLGRALVDKDVREKLLTNPDALAKEHGISGKDAESLKHVNRKDLEDAASRFANHADWTIAVGISGHFDVK